ncbi:general stress protein [Paenibacillus koleovorans]|uniref:general stress protein n=1 Tax=Paenibacillus koleovorans TaxID=121608 RepID=UPI000FD8E1FD|nr:general stress protein [Paenibacillus koleovorans]
MYKYTKVAVADSIPDAQNKIRQYNSEGFDREHIYVLTHTPEGTEYVAESTGASEIGMAQEGMLNSIANLFRSRGDELRAKMEALDVPESEAERLEEELDQGKIVILAAGGR